MKQLILVRHAKSDWGDPALDDFDRPLNERGKKDAPMMAQRLIDKKVKIDLFVSSPAKRAAKTARIFADAFGKKKEDIEFIQGLYLASVPQFLEVIKNLNKKKETVALFSHNEGLTYFANILTKVKVDNIPTCGIYAIKADCRNWSEFEEAPKEFWFFDYPKAT
jgi:phosphohistidine phosphatase